LNIYSGGLTLNSGARVFAYLTAPSGAVMINGNCQIVGGIACDRLSLNSNGPARPLSHTLYVAAASLQRRKTNFSKRRWEANEYWSKLLSAISYRWIWADSSPYTLFPEFGCSYLLGFFSRRIRARWSHHRIEQVFKDGGWVLTTAGVRR